MPQLSMPPQAEMVQMSMPLNADARQLRSGMVEWSRKPSPNSTWQITGSDYSQLLEVEIQPNELVTCEPGTMTYMSPDLETEVDMNGCEQGCKRCCCAGESMFRLHFRNETDEVQQVALSPNFPAQIVPVDLGKYDGMIFNRGAFLAALGSDWSVDIKRVKSAGVVCCGGQGLFMNTLHGSGFVFLNAGGTVLTKQLAEGEELIVDQNSVLAFEKSVDLSVRTVGGCMICCFGGMGLMNSVLTGPGFVMVHTMGMAKLRSSLAVQGGNGGGGGGGGDAGASS